MQVHRCHFQVPAKLKGAVAAIGNFDGVHLGHQSVLRIAQAHASECHAPTAAISFEPHPRAVITPERAPTRLTPLREKIRLLRELGIETLFLFRFDHSLMSIGAEPFIDDLLIGQLGLKGIVCGGNFRFGHKRSGDVALLRRHGAEAGLSTICADPVSLDGEICSSSRIRAALEQGDINLANQLLGRDHSVLGVVRPGDQRGRTIGFPTANVHPICTNITRPAHGVYAVRARLRDGRVMKAVANLGRRPTFDGRTTLLEVYLFDYEGDLYGQRLDVMFVERIRDEQKFDGIEALKRQINIDSVRARQILSA